MIPDELQRFYRERGLLARRSKRAAKTVSSGFDLGSLLSGLFASAPPASPAKAPTKREPIPKKLRYEVLKRDGGRCRLCGAASKDGATLHIDHITPVSLGGKTTKANLQTLCQACNLGKGNRDRKRW